MDSGMHDEKVGTAHHTEFLHDQADSRLQRAGVTLRAVLLGLFVAVAVNAWITLTEYVVHASRMNLAHFPVALVAVYFFTVIAARAAGFKPGEMATVLAMGLVASAVPTSGLMGFWLGSMATPYYFATPQNRWGEIYHPNIREWLVPSDANHAIEWFYNGVPAGQQAPWQEWIVPLIWWLGLISAIVLLTLCIAAVLRKPWVESERLVFPIAEVGVMLAQDDGSGSRLPAVFRTRLFRVGFCISFFIMAWNVLGFFDPSWPTIPLTGDSITPFRGFYWFGVRLNFLTLGLCYFANTDVLFSLWVFFLLAGTQRMILTRIGHDLGPLGDDWSSLDPVIAWESFGAIVVFVLWGLWNAREHLRYVIQAAFRGGDANRDRKELLDFRIAVFGGVLALAYIISWLHAAGMTWVAAIVWTTTTIIIFIGVARIVCESGLPYVRGPLTSQSFLMYGLGSANFPPSTITAMVFTYGLFSQGKGLFMAPFMHAAKLASQVKSARKMTTAVVLAMVAGVAVCLVLTIVLGYSMGAFNFQDYPFSSAGRHMFQLSEKYLTSPTEVLGERWAFLGIGGSVMAVLMFLRARFPWWPLSPIGMTIAATYPTTQSVFVIFLAWATKTIILRLGGVQMYDKTKPLFLGLICGYAVGLALSFAVDVIWFPGLGHRIHSW